MILAAGSASFSWSGFFGNAAAFAAIIGLLGVLVTLVEAALRRWPRFRQWALSAPLRAATHKYHRAGEYRVEQSDLHVLADEFGSVRHFRKLITDLIFQNENEIEAGFILADLLAAPPLLGVSDHELTSVTLRGEHHWTRLAPVFLRIFTTAAKLRSTRLLARVLYPEDVQIYATWFGDIAQAVGQLAVSAPVSFERYRPAVGDKRADNSTKASFASFATAFSGSIVLVDASESRSMCAEQVLVWHSRRFHEDFSMDDMKRGTDYLRGRYEDTHKNGVGCEHWGERSRRIGDFDQRVLHLRSVALAEATAESGLSIVLETSETCYGISELGVKGMGCKNVAARLTNDDDPNDPVFYRRFTSTAQPGNAQYYDYRIARENPDAGRITLLTAQLALITADDRLVLQHRTAKVRHDASLIGASAGGVISLGGIIASGDLDSNGWPDPTAAIVREAREETGVQIAASSCQPLCVYLLNIRDGSGMRGSIPPGGQLGAAVLYLARTPLTSIEVEDAAKTGADQARGRFEHSGLTMCPVDSSENIAKWMESNATQLSAHALMACIYSALVIFGRSDAEAAISNAFTGDPWWAISPYWQPVPRLVRDPRNLIQAGCIDEIGPKAWGAAWKNLRSIRTKLDPEISPLISARCAGDIALRLVAQQHQSAATAPAEISLRTTLYEPLTCANDLRRPPYLQMVMRRSFPMNRVRGEERADDDHLVHDDTNAEGAGDPHSRRLAIMGRLHRESSPSVTAGQRVPVKVPGRCTREDGLDSRLQLP